jgi:tRNA (guanine37-N1)-methyltransferase
MKIDIVSIFPEYLDPLRLSLVGKAVETGIVGLGVHDLRDWTHDRHRTVDDTPYGGGAGMVMKPEPWGEALDDLGSSTARLVILTPSGRTFTQAVAHELAAESHLIFACGRYEGIDARVAEAAGRTMRVDELSIGDYVLNGGEAAALVIVEAVVRLLPGVIGNPASLAEESHGVDHDGLLEYPAYTKPPSWRGLDVPEILFSGHHEKIAQWRRDRALDRTRERRPDLLPQVAAPVVVERATDADVGEILTLQRATFLSEARLNGRFDLPPLVETYGQLRRSFAAGTVLVARRGRRIIGAVMGNRANDTRWGIGRLMVAPDQQGAGIGSRLLAAIEVEAPAGVEAFVLFTGPASAGNLAFYGRRGYSEVERQDDPDMGPIVIMEKAVRR